MGARAWSKSAASNTTVGGIYIGPDMARADVDNAKRAMMAELKPIIDAVSVSPMEFGAVGDGVANDTSAVAQALATGKNVILKRGQTFAVTNLTGFVNNQRIHGGGCLKKYGPTVEAMCVLPDNADGIWFDGIEFNGNKSAFSYGNGVPAVSGYLTYSARFTGCYFHDIIDAGIKLRNAMNVVVDGNRFIDCIENAVELQIYVIDPRTGVAYTGTHPALCGNHRITNNYIEGSTRLEDVGTGIVDACGVLIASVNASYPPRNCIVSGNTIVDCLRGIWTEANVAGTEARDLTIQGNTIQGGVGGGTAELIYNKGGIGIIGAKGCTIKGNTIRNPGNYDASGTDTACIYVSASNGITTNDGILIEGNVMIDDTGDSLRTKYGLVVTLGTNVQIRNNYISGMRTNPESINTSLVTKLVVTGNQGGTSDFSWSNLVKHTFALPNVPASATTKMPIVGQSGNVDAVQPCAGRIVAASARAADGQGFTGTYSVQARINNVIESGVSLLSSGATGTQANFALVDSTSQSLAKRTTDAGTQMLAGDRISVIVTTDGSWTNTHDLYVDVWVDTGMKQ